METVIIVIHLMVIVALIAVVLLQRSEGGALGIGGGGGNPFMSGRGQANVLTRATTILGIVFFATSIGMTVLSRLNEPPSSILDAVPTAPGATAPAVGGGINEPGAGGGILDQLNQLSGQTSAPTPTDDGAVPAVPVEPQVPTSQ